MNLSERVAVMDSKLSSFVTSEHLGQHTTHLAVLSQKVSELVKRVEALENK
jgi:hypothetical protein